MRERRAAHVAANREKINAEARAWRKRHPERVAAASRSQRAKNPERLAEYDRLKKARNPEKYKELVKAWKAKNPDKLKQYRIGDYERNKEKMKAATARWARANPDKTRAIKAKRRSLEINATVLWADKNAIKAIYAEAERKTIETGIRHVVDHIIPLNNPLVCGLHCETNLRVITAEDNSKKGNRAWPGSPDRTSWEWAASAEFKALWKLLCADLPRRCRPPWSWDAISKEDRAKMATARNLDAWAKRTPEQRAAVGAKIAAGWAARGSKPIRLTPEQLSERAKLAWQTRRAAMNRVPEITIGG